MKSFKYFVLGLTLILLEIPSLSFAPPAHASPCVCENLPDVIEKVGPGVVNISSTTITRFHVQGMDDYLQFWGFPRERKQTSLGSGFIIDNEGHIITNHHVVANATEVLVTLSDKRHFKAKIIGSDDKMDLALLQLRTADNKIPEKLSPVPLGDSEEVRVGETVIAVGNPFGLQDSVSRGIISSKHRTIGLGPLDHLIQTDASINPGNSGGPLFSGKGKVIGINTMIRSNTGQNSGVSFAIPINEAKILLPDLIKYGRVPRPWLGILAERMSPQLAEYYELGTSKGVLIYNIVQRAPAHLSGLKQGDVVVSIGGQATDDPNDVERVLAKLKPKGKVDVEIFRGAKKRKFTIQLQELPKLEHLPRGII